MKLFLLQIAKDQFSLKVAVYDIQKPEASEETRSQKAFYDLQICSQTTGRLLFNFGDTEVFFWWFNLVKYSLEELLAHVFGILC